MQEDIFFSSLLTSNECALEDDLCYIKSCYPRKARRCNEVIERECDKLEYEGSPMYVEIPDKDTIHRMAERIAAEDSLNMQDDIPFVTVMLCNEIYIRRCRKEKRCRMFGQV